MYGFVVEVAVSIEDPGKNCFAFNKSVNGTPALIPTVRGCEKTETALSAKTPINFTTVEHNRVNRRVVDAPRFRSAVDCAALGATGSVLHNKPYFAAPIAMHLERSPISIRLIPSINPVLST